jgi:gliding motility-associated-like protein
MSFRTGYIPILLCLLGANSSSFGQDLCSSTNPNLIANGFEFIGPSEGCGQFTVKLEDKTGGSEIKYIYYYQGEDKSQLNNLNSTTETENPYLSQPQTSNYTILQYGKKADGTDFYSCGNVKVHVGKKPVFSYTLCTRGVEVVLPKNDENLIYEELRVTLSLSGISEVITKDELPKSINLPISYPDYLTIEGIETGGNPSGCNTITSKLEKLDPSLYPNGIDIPFDINIDSLELVEADRARLTFSGSLDSKGYTLQMRESMGNYPSIALKENVISGKVDFQLPDKNKSYCFKLSRQASCGSYEFSAEICTIPITSIDIDKYGLIRFYWLNHVKPSTSQSFNQKKELEINQVNKGIIQESIPLNTDTYAYNLSCGLNKVCFRLSNKVSGLFYDYKYLGTSISNEVCVSSDSIIAPPIQELYTTVNDNELIDVFFKNNKSYITPIAVYYLHQLDSLSQNFNIIDSSFSKTSFENMVFNKGIENCFKVSYVDTCGIRSEGSAEICTITLSNSSESNLNWTPSLPFGSETILNYELWTLDETTNSFNLSDSFFTSENETKIDLETFKDVALFKIKAKSISGIASFSNLIEIPLQIKLFLPEAFSPNNDGINDQFQLFGSLNKIKDFNIIIYDRKGTVVYQSNRPNFIWDGSFNNNLVNKGVYNYWVSLISQKNEPFTKSGSITLL